jgi:hypothetical protein
MDKIATDGDWASAGPPQSRDDLDLYEGGFDWSSCAQQFEKLPAIKLKSSPHSGGLAGLSKIE